MKESIEVVSGFEEDELEDMSDEELEECVNEHSDIIDKVLRWFGL